MIEVSITDVLLFVWAVIATAYSFKCKEDSYKHQFILHKVLSDKKVREDLIESYNKAIGKQA